MLSLPTGFSDEKLIETTKNLSAALSLFDKLQTVRELIIDLSNTVGSPDSSIQELRDRELALFKRSLILGQDENEGSRGIPKLLSERHNNTLFFLQLVDHIILRSIRLFQSWRDVLAMEEKKRQMEKATSSKVSSLRGRVAAGSTFVSNEDDTASVGTDEIDQISVNSTLFATRLSHSDLSAWQK